MSLLENFKPFNFNEGVPYVSITINGMTFNKSVIMKLEYPVNCESSIAEGTLLMHWQESALKSKVFFESSAEKKFLTASMRAMFPANIKKNTNVKSSG